MRRFIQAEPLYQVGYLIGGRQILALHDEMVGPGKLSERQFHDAVLEQGCMPIELLRAALMGIPLPKDARPSWRFAEVDVARLVLHRGAKKGSFRAGHPAGPAGGGPQIWGHLLHVPCGGL